MRLSQIKINNYKNLQGLNIKFDLKNNFLVGENDLGKSNFLDLLDKTFNGKYYEEDFFDKNVDINVDFSLFLDDSELGIFNDLMDPSDANRINISSKMGFTDDYISYFHTETGEDIRKDAIKCVNFIKYSSLRKPADELDFFKKRGAGKLLHYIVEKLLEDENLEELLDEDLMNDLISNINVNFSKIRIFEEFGIETSVEDDPIDLISRMLSIKDANGIEIKNIGHGVQFSVLIVLSILEKLIYIVENRKSKKCIFQKDGVKSISLILGLDEPEIHLHPYRQRNLIKYIGNLLDNNEEGFSSLIKEIFGIDEINGQSIVVTHSPNILTDDYTKIIRFYKNKGIVNVKSGSDIKLDEQLHKHLLKNMPYVKEAFFSRCNILVEGDSEYGAFPIFAKKEDLDLDELGISIIQLGGANSVVPFADLLNLFGIQNVGILDKKEYNTYEQDIKDKHLNIASTAYEDFEYEVYKSTKIEDYIKFIENEFPRNKCFFYNAARSQGITVDCSKTDLYKQIEIIPKFKKLLIKKSLEMDCINFLGKDKTLIFGRDIAYYVTRVPYSYRNVLLKAKRLSNE